ncbi:hypothetical protein [Nocardioides sp.]|uniref:hypothetical protein n=1 Tax=Nocardioides sp. TaxID=35761 RepID=UPI0037849008
MTTVILPRNVRPEIVCPSWCTVSTEDHIAELANLEGYAIHWSSSSGGVEHSSMTYTDGSPGPEPGQVYCDGWTKDLTLTEAEQLAHAILAAVKEARGAN